MPRWLKIIVALGLVGVLLAGIEWRALPQHLEALRWGPALLALLVVAVEMPVNAWKWSWSLRLHDLRFGAAFLFRTSCIGFFFNNFLPSAIGGDLYRIYRTLPAQGERSPAVSAVIVERLAGLAALLCNGLIGAIFLQEHSALARLYIGIAAAWLAAAIFGAVGLYKGWFKPLTRLVLRIRFLAPVEANLRRIVRPRPEWVPLLATSFLFQLLAALVIWLAFAAVGSEIGFPTALLIAAAAGLASVLPISISGIGVVEGSMAGTAVALGSSYEASLLAAVLVRLIVLPVSAACGIVYLLEPRESRTPRDEWNAFR